MSTVESNSDRNDREMASKRTRIRHGQTSPSAEDSSCVGRRHFLAGLAAMAAPSVLGAGQAQAAPPAGSPSKPNPTKPASQPAAASLPTIQLGPYRISRLVAGANPLGGHSYQGPHTDDSMKEYFTLERKIEFLKNCEREGIMAHQFSTYEDADYLLGAREKGVKLHYFGLHSGVAKLKEAIQTIRPIAMVHHGGATDRQFSLGKQQEVHDFVKAAHDNGVMAGVSAHNPDCIKRIADEGWEADFFMTCFYFVTREWFPEAVKKVPPVPTMEISYPFYKDDPAVMTAVVRQVKQPCFGFKILAGGRACRNERRVREAFKIAFSSIKPIDGVIVGMFPRYADEVQFDVQAAQKYGRIPST